MTAEHIARIALDAITTFDMCRLWQAARLMEWIGALA